MGAGVVETPARIKENANRRVLYLHAIISMFCGKRVRINI